MQSGFSKYYIPTLAEASLPLIFKLNNSGILIFYREFCLTHIGYQGGEGIGATPQGSHHFLDLGKVDQISFVLSP